ncbi:Gamma-glutamyltranspeptidase [Cynara cardunculus var. scolymus]|uniref:Gamma-glutamyltranspeptidase n=1 Tax=Cynara cardunculus var. scolymus TaxID=59895 RepID=A0A103Y299_CYNCS|nr:Gamma-glutamyltranspeptidase [Cynara cardunculus var. scolymus]
MGVPGEIAGLYEAWLKYGRRPWKELFQPAIRLVKDGFLVAPYLANSLSGNADTIMKDPGLRHVYAPNGKVLQAGETCYNHQLGLSLEAIAEGGPEALYNGAIGEKLISDVQSGGGILTMDDMRNYKVKVTDAVEVNTMGFTILGMPPPWSQIQDHGTSHFCIVDADRNALSMTTTVNYPFGGGVLSQATGILLNNEMADFSVPTEVSPDSLPPSPTNFIRPNKRPLSSMTPIIIVKDDQLAGVLGGSGGLYIIPAVIQVFLNHFVLGMEPLDAIQSPRVYHKLMPNVVYYENWTMIDGDHIELSNYRKKFLKERGHQLESKAGGGVSIVERKDLCRVR